MARQGEVEAERRGQIVIDPEAEALSLLSSPVRPSEQLVSVSYFSADAVTATLPFGEHELQDPARPGRWSTEATVPASAEGKTYTLRVSVRKKATKFDKEAAFSWTRRWQTPSGVTPD